MTKAEIQKLYGKYKTPEHVQQHMRIVAEVAVFLAGHLQKNNIKININFTKNLALLHDFLKMLVFTEKNKKDPAIWKTLRKKYPDTHDTEVASLILQQIKESKLAKGVRTQQFDAIISKNHPLSTIEEKIVYYADKRVAHTKIVTLKERFEEGNKRYPPTRKEMPVIRLIQKKIYALEKQLCTQAQIKPEVLQFLSQKKIFL